MKVIMFAHHALYGNVAILAFVPAWSEEEEEWITRAVIATEERGLVSVPLDNLDMKVDDLAELFENGS